jgi:hypothetical protein
MSDSQYSNGFRPLVINFVPSLNITNQLQVSKRYKAVETLAATNLSGEPSKNSDAQDLC